MDILYLLIPLSAVLVLAILGVFAWALWRGQFDDLERHGEAMLAQDPQEAAAEADGTVATPAAAPAPGPVDPRQAS